jgi:hypothetical protein
MEGIDLGVTVGLGEKSRRLKNLDSVGVAGGRATFDGEPFLGDADFVLRWEGVQRL